MMDFPWQVAGVPFRQAQPMEFAGGAFPVPESLSPEQFPPAVKAAILRPLAASSKPAVTLQVMNATQSSMIAPDLPFRCNV